MDLLSGYGSDDSIDSDHSSDHSEKDTEGPKHVKDVSSLNTGNSEKAAEIAYQAEEVSNEESINGTAQISDETNDVEENIENSDLVEDINTVSTECVVDESFSPISVPLLTEEQRNRDSESIVDIHSCVEDDSEIICLSSEYGEYGTQSRVICAKSANLIGRNVEVNAYVLGRKTMIDKDVIVRGDLGQVAIGNYCYIGSRTVVRPPWRIEMTSNNERKSVWSNVTIGSYVMVGRDCVIESFCIGSFVKICDGCILGKHTILKDCCLICPGSVLPPYMVVPPFAIVQGAPARIVGELPESAGDEYKYLAERNCRARVFQKA